jgi:hypothetical protein
LWDEWLLRLSCWKVGGLNRGSSEEVNLEVEVGFNVVFDSD